MIRRWLLILLAGLLLTGWGTAYATGGTRQPTEPGERHAGLGSIAALGLAASSASGNASLDAFASNVVMVYQIVRSNDGECVRDTHALAKSYATTLRDSSPSYSFFDHGEAFVAKTGVSNPAATNDDFDAATPLIVSDNGLGSQYLDTDTTDTTVAPDDPDMLCGNGRNVHTVCFKVTPSFAGAVHFRTYSELSPDASSNYDTVLAVFTGTRGALNLIACNDDAGSRIQSDLTFPVIVGQTYYVEGAQYGTTPGGGRLSLFSWRDLTVATTTPTATQTTTATRTYTPSATPTPTPTTTVTSTETPKCVALTLQMLPTSGGTIAFDLAPNCGPGKFLPHTAISISAISNSRWTFQNWSATSGTFTDANQTNTTFTFSTDDVTLTDHFAAWSPTSTPTPTNTPTNAITPTATDSPTTTPTYVPSPTATVTRPPNGEGDPYEPDDTCTLDHTFHNASDQDWVAFQATACQRYLVLGDVPAGSRADLVLIPYRSCGAVPDPGQDYSFTAGARLEFQAQATGPVYLKLMNHTPSVAGADVAYSISVRRLQENAETGVLILVAGRIREDDPLQSRIYAVTDAVYRLFLAHGYSTDRIFYLAPDFRTGVDAAASADNLRAAITTWARDKAGTNRPLTLYMMDHGAQESFYLDRAGRER